MQKKNALNIWQGFLLISEGPNCGLHEEGKKEHSDLLLLWFFSCTVALGTALQGS